jgi:para-aminobenzoate synthetase component 1
MRFHPNVDLSGGAATTNCNCTWERSRLHWHVGDPGDPATLATRFLQRYGLGLPGTLRDHAVEEICGASLFISAAASAVMIGAPPGPPSPCPAVPDLVVVVHAHADARGPGHAEAPDLGAGDFTTVEWEVGAWEPSWSMAGHRSAVERVREAIARGDVYQVNVVGHASAPYRGDPSPALLRIAGLPGATYAGVLSGPGWSIATATPELLVRVEAGLVETRPIKGTRPATEAGRLGLLASAKERAEHVMIVDLERNDLAHLARTGTVEVPELFAVRRWCDLWQAESTVTARLVDGLDLADLLRAVCPGGSVTGAPKLAALAQIATLEPVGRGPSMGAFGWLDDQRLELGLTIRTVAADGERLHVWAGGGITWDSDPAGEVAEAQAKAAPLYRALAARSP